MGSGFTPGEWLFRYSDKYRPLSMEEAALGKETCLCVTLTALEENGRFRRLRVWVTREKYLVRKIETTDRNDNVASYLILSLARDPRFPSSLFAFKPPKGTEVIDMRE
jgi:outer membrane lipoprotein-sorting protein